MIVPVPLSALVPLTDEAEQAIFIEAAELPDVGEGLWFELVGLALYLRTTTQSTVYCVNLGPAEWAKVHAGQGWLHAVDRYGEVIASYAIQLTRAA